MFENWKPKCGMYGPECHNTAKYYLPYCYHYACSLECIVLLKGSGRIITLTKWQLFRMGLSGWLSYFNYKWIFPRLWDN